MGTSGVHIAEVDKLQSKSAAVTLPEDASMVGGDEADDREEGEIVDDYDIISSDEELTMLQRIRELEATNDELEKIARISGNYENEYNYTARNITNAVSNGKHAAPIDCSLSRDAHRAARVPTDASSISSVEFSTPKKKKRRKTKANKCKVAHLLNKSYHDRHHHHHHRRQFDCKKHRSRFWYPELDLETISLDSYESLVGDTVDDTGEDTNVELYLNREELRLALARPTPKEAGTGLKERLQRVKKAQVDDEKRKACSNEPIVMIDIETDKESEVGSDNSISLEEQELRLIALKSAVMKKHWARKKRNAELAYSPTDFDDILGAAHSDDNMDVVEVDLDDMQAGMEISPATSPKLILSPEQNVEECSNASETMTIKSTVDTKLVDMDIANSDTDDEIYMCKDQSEKWVPIDQIPLPMVAADMNLPTAYNTMAMEYSTPAHYEIYMSQYEPNPPPPPPPPGVTDYEEAPPPPPPFNLILQSDDNYSISEGQSDNSMEYASRQSPNSQIQTENKANLSELSNKFSQSSSVKLEPLSSLYSQENTRDSHQSDEEEEALRALLLSRFQSPKSIKSTAIPSDKRKPSPQPTSTYEQMPAINPTESILKGAVNRLKMKSNLPSLIKSSKISEKQPPTHTCQNHSKNLQEKPIDQDTAHISCMNEVNATKSYSEEIPFESCRIVDNSKISNLQNDHSSLESANIIVKSGDQSKKENVIQDDKIEECPSTQITDELGESCELVENSSADNIMAISIDNALNAKLETNSKVTEHDATALKLKPLVLLNESETEQINTKTEEKWPGAKETNETLPLMPIPDEVLHDRIDKNANIAPSRLDENTAIPKTTKSYKNTNSPALPSGTAKKSTPVSHKTTLSSTSKLKGTPSPDTKPKTNASSVSAISSYSIKQKNILRSSSIFKPNSLSNLPLRSNKIIKPNKIINTNAMLKRKSTEVVSKIPTKTSKTSNTETLEREPLAAASGSRLITSANLPSLQVKKLIITLRASESETSEDETTNSLPVTRASLETGDSSSCGLNSYYDNASPISLPMDSPRANSPCVDNAENEKSEATKSAVNVFFEQKLDNFLRDVRCKVQQSSSAENCTKLKATNVALGQSTNFATPVAVRHLPEASQQEYRRLINRMNTLEKQKESKKIEDKPKNIVPNADAKSELNNEEPHLDTLKEAPKLVPVSRTLTLPPSIVANEKTLIKKVLIKNAASKTTPKKGNSKTIPPYEPSKVNVLRAYENSFLKIGSGIICNLDKSLQLVEVAKRAKMAKLLYEQRLKVLRAEIEEVTHKFKQEQQTMAKIFPEICGSNEVIASLKQRRVKLFKAASNLGTSIKGADYRLDNELKVEISHKTKKLASEIKLVNSISYSNVKKFENNGIAANSKIVDTVISASQLKSTTPTETAAAERTELESEHIEDTPTLSTTIDNQRELITKSNKSPIQEASEQIGENCVTGAPEMEMTEKELGSENHEEREEDTKRSEQPRKMENLQRNNEDIEEPTQLREYVSPLEHLKTYDSQLDPNGIICPYELMGQCEDHDCSFMHLTITEKTNAQ